MIGVWGLTEELAKRDVRARSICQVEYEKEMDRIAEIERIGSTDPKGFQSYTSKSSQDDRKAEAERKRTLCFETQKKAREWNAKAYAQMAQEGQDALAAAQARLAMQSAPKARGGLSWWLLPILALVPLGYFLFRRKK